MSAADKAMRARVEGRQKTAARMLWSLTIGGVALRCLAAGEFGYEVQARGPSGWQPLFADEDPLAMLKAVVLTSTVEEALAALREAGR